MALNMRPSGLVLEKKQILPWYDTTLVYLCLALFAMGTAIFSLTGIHVAQGTPGFSKYVWVPRLLLIMSVVLVCSCGLRLLFRLFLRLRDSD